MPYPLPLTRTEAYLAYKAGVIQQPDLKPSLIAPRNGIDAWLAYWTGLTHIYPVKNVGKNLFNVATAIDNHWLNYQTGKLINDSNPNVVSNFIEVTSGTTYTISGADDLRIDVWQYAAQDENTATARIVLLANQSHTFTPNTPWIRFAVGSGDAISVKNQFMLEAGSTATSFEPYTGEPLILQEEEAYIAYLCGVINEYPEKCLRRVGAYLRYLISARWGRPDHPLNREELYLSLIKTQFIPSGDPSSDIVIDGTAKAPFVDVKMYGNTTQQTYSGINLLNKPQSYSFTRDLNFQRLPAGTYYVSCGEVTKGGENAPEFGDSSNHISLTSNMLNSVLTVSSSVRLTAYSNGWSWGDSTVTSTVEKLIVTSSPISTLDDYEPYVGGTASPNPDYPQAVNTVTGRQVVKVEGKNLINEAFTDGYMMAGGSSNGVLVTNNHDGSVSLSGKSTVSGTFRLNDIDGARISLKAGDVVTLSNDQNLPANTRMVLRGTESSDAIITILGGSKTGTATIASDMEAFVFIGVTAANVDTDGVTLKPMLEKGSTATAYEPYSSNDYEINLGKNLFDKSSATILDAFIDYGQSSMKISDYAGGRTTYIKCQPNTTYTVSKMLSARFVVATTSVVPANNVTINQYVVANDSTSATITTDGSANYLAVFYYNSSFDTSAPQQILDTLQFEEGSTATPYAPYFTPIELCKIGTYQDYIYKSDGEWKVHKATVKKVLNGSEDWKDATVESTTGYFRGSVHLGGYKTTLGYSNKILVRQGTHGAYEYVWLQNTETGNTYLQVLGRRLPASTLDAFKEWLETNNITIYGVPYDDQADTTITNQALIDQLEALVAGGAENGTTYIKVNANDPNLPGLLYVEAPKYE